MAEFVNGVFFFFFFVASPCHGEKCAVVVSSLTPVITIARIRNAHTRATWSPAPKQWFRITVKTAKRRDEMPLNHRTRFCHSSLRRRSAPSSSPPGYRDWTASIKLINSNVNAEAPHAQFHSAAPTYEDSSSFPSLSFVKFFVAGKKRKLHLRVLIFFFYHGTRYVRTRMSPPRGHIFP